MSSQERTPRTGKAGKVKKSYANCPSIQLIVRDNKGWRLYKQHHKTGKLQIQSSTKPCTDADIIFSADGQYFAVLLEEGIEIYESSGGRKLHFLKHYRVRNVYFSPNNSFIVSYHHRRADDKHGNCWVWKWKSSPSTASGQNTGDQKEDINATQNQNDDPSNTENAGSSAESKDIKVIYQFFLPEFDKKRVPLQFTNDEYIAARITRNAVLIHDVQRLHYKSNNIIGKIDIANVASVVVAPTRRQQQQAQNSYILAVFAMPKNNKAATVTVYEYQYSLAMNKRSNTSKLFTKISQRAFYGVDQCELLWDPTTSYHHNLLAIASSDVDTSGKSYYGNQTLFLLSSRNNITVKIPISEKGKLQDVKWHPFGKEFVMIDDHPQKITVFDYKGNEVKNLGKYARNLIRFSRDGSFLWCGGFGNLTGEMTFYDYKQIKNDKMNCLGYNTDDACRYFQWSPDSSTFLTARLYPYMTVDNGFRIYKYNGYRLYEEKFDRLYQIAYRPNLKGVYPERSPSPNARGKAKSLPKPQAKKRYVPPHLRAAKDKADNKNKRGGQRQQQQPQQPQQQRQPQRQPAQQQHVQQSQQQQQAQVPPRRQQPPPQQQQQYNNNHNVRNSNNNGMNTHYNMGYPQNYQQMSMNQQQHQQQQSQSMYGQQPSQRQQPPPQQQQYNGNNNGGHNHNQNYYASYQQHQQQQFSDVHNHVNNNMNNNNNSNFQSGVYQHGMEQGDYLQPQHNNHNQQIQQTQHQFQQMNVGNNNNIPQQPQMQNDNDGGDDGGNKKKRRRKRKSKSKQNQQQNQGGTGGGGGGFKPGLAENDNKRWARGSKYTE